MPDPEIEYVRKVILTEAEAVRSLARHVGKSVKEAVDLIFTCKGRVVLTGMGKAGIVGQKISATLASTGTPSYFLHPAEAVHGDLGRIVRQDVVLALSNLGETEEILRLLPAIHRIGAKIIAITGNPQSDMARHSDVVIDLGKIEEPCPLGLAPSASTTAMLALGDALALTVLRKRKFGKEEYAFYHPGGGLGRKLLLVDEIMRPADENATVLAKTPVRNAIANISQTGKRGSGAVCVVNRSGRLLGIFTDGDLRRNLQKDTAFLDRPIETVMTARPKTVRKGSLAADAYKILHEFRLDEVPVVDAKGRFVGMVDVQDLLDTVV
ncbi:MAG: KpsF/GutQ family sugar-phosphate isomerase [Planctomycetota bacterium]